VAETGKYLTLDQVDLMRRERLALSRLSEKQKLFAEEWVRTFSKVLALKAGKYWTPKQKGSSQTDLLEKTFEKVMSSATVQEYIFLLKQSVASRLGVSMDDILDEYKSMAFTNMDDYVEWTDRGFTKFKSSKQLTRAQKAGILEITETTTKSGTVVKIKLHNKQTALDRLFEILKELEEKEKGAERPVKVSQTQINLILQDPMMRRAIEYLADGMFDKKVSLVGTDNDRIVFEKNMAKITNKLMEATSGVAGTRSVGVPCLSAPEATSGEGVDGEDIGQGSEDAADELATGNELTEGEAEGAALQEEGPEVLKEDGSRYDIDGL